MKNISFIILLAAFLLQSVNVYNSNKKLAEVNIALESAIYVCGKGSDEVEK